MCTHTGPVNILPILRFHPTSTQPPFFSFFLNYFCRFVLIAETHYTAGWNASEGSHGLSNWMIIRGRPPPCDISQLGYLSAKSGKSSGPWSPIGNGFLMILMPFIPKRRGRGAQRTQKSFNVIISVWLNNAVGMVTYWIARDQHKQSTQSFVGALN